MKFTIIFSGDYDCQILKILPNRNSNEAWDIANEMYTSGELKDNGIDHYDVIEFDSLDVMNSWIFNNVKESRKNKI